MARRAATFGTAAVFGKDGREIPPLLSLSLSLFPKWTRTLARSHWGLDPLGSGLSLWVVGMNCGALLAKRERIGLSG